MEVVSGQPAWIGMAPVARNKIRQVPQASGVGEDKIDHLRGQTELGDDQDRHSGRHGFECGGRGYGHQCLGRSQRITHRAVANPERARLDSAGPHQLVDQLDIGPPLVVGLLLGVFTPHLDDSGPSCSQGEQNLLPMLPFRWDLCLGSEDEVGARQLAIVGHRAGSQKRQRCQTEHQAGSQSLAQGSKFGDLAVTVQQEQITSSAKRNCSGAGRHANAWQTGDQHWTVRVAKLAAAGQRRDHGSGTRQQHSIRLLGAKPLDDLSAG